MGKRQYPRIEAMQQNEIPCLSKNMNEKANKYILLVIALRIKQRPVQANTERP